MEAVAVVMLKSYAWPTSQDEQCAFIICNMQPVHDVARIRLDNALLLFDEFVQAQIKHPDAAALRGLERRFAERLQIQASYWSQIKSRSRQIGERLARQFEHLCHKPRGWMDEPHGAASRSGSSADDRAPRTDDERFIVALVLSYYRRHPERARMRLLELLGEALAPSSAASAAAPAGEGDVLWQRARSGVAPLKRRR
jgi:hypothetical protein